MMAMLLAAGRGERMRPLTDHTPKPLLLAGGKPLIVWHIENLAHAGIRDLVINHAHLGSQIEAVLGDGSRLGVRIRYSPENPALETAGGIANALPLLCSPDNFTRDLSRSELHTFSVLPPGEGGGEPFAVINSDIYCGYDFAQLPAHAAALKQRGDAAHLVLVNNPPQHPNGDFYLHAGRVISSALSTDETTSHSTRRENNTHQVAGYQHSALTFSGIGIYQPALFAPIARGSSAPLAPLLRAQIAQGKVSGEHYTGRWVDVGTPQRLEELDKLLRATHNASHA